MKTAGGKRGGLRMSGLRSGWLGASRRPVALSDLAGDTPGLARLSIAAYWA